MSVRSCARCGAQLAGHVKFCGSCGSPTRAHVRARHAERAQRSRRDRGAIAAIALVYTGTLLTVVALSWWAWTASEEGEVPAAAWWLFAGVDLAVGLAAVRMLGSGALRASLARLPVPVASWWQGAVAGLLTYAMSWVYIAVLLALVDVDPEAETETLVVIVHTVVVAPLIEEWLCRGVLWEALSRVTSPRATLVLTSFLFGMLHCLGGFLGFPNRFVAGLVFGWLRQRSGSLLPGILAHGVNNVLAVALH